MPLLVQEECCNLWDGMMPIARDVCVFLGKPTQPACYKFGKPLCGTDLICPQQPQNGTSWTQIIATTTAIIMVMIALYGIANARMSSQDAAQDARLAAIETNLINLRADINRLIAK